MSFVSLKYQNCGLCKIPLFCAHEGGEAVEALVAGLGGCVVVLDVGRLALRFGGELGHLSLQLSHASLGAVALLLHAREVLLGGLLFLRGHEGRDDL